MRSRRSSCLCFSPIGVGRRTDHDGSPGESLFAAFPVLFWHCHTLFSVPAKMP